MFFFAGYLWNYITLAAAFVTAAKIYKNDIKNWKKKIVQGYIKLYYSI